MVSSKPLSLHYYLLCSLRLAAHGLGFPIWKGKGPKYLAVAETPPQDCISDDQAVRFLHYISSPSSPFFSPAFKSTSTCLSRVSYFYSIGMPSLRDPPVLNDKSIEARSS